MMLSGIGNTVRRKSPFEGVLDDVEAGFLRNDFQSLRHVNADAIQESHFPDKLNNGRNELNMTFYR